MNRFTISPGTALVVWSLLLLLAAALFPVGYWTIDDCVKAISATRGDGALHTTIADGELRSRLSDPAGFAPLAPPFAERIEDGYAPGFTPGARLLARVENIAGWRGMLIVNAVIAVGVGWLLYSAGLTWGFLLLPLTFYGLVPWEHGLALLLSLPLLFAGFVHERDSSSGIVFTAGALAALAVLFRLEHVLLLVAGLIGLLVNRRYRDFLFSGVGALVVCAILWGFVGSDTLLHTWRLNEQAAAGAGLALELYQTVIALGPNVLFTAAALAMLLFSLWQIDRRGVSRPLLVIASLGVALFAVYLVRVLWTGPYGLLTLINLGSFAFALPWVLWAMLKADFWKEKAAVLAVALLGIGIFTLPQAQGVHWGPRLLLFTVPLFLIALYRAGLERRMSFSALLFIMLVQALSGAGMVYARYTESWQHIDRLEGHTGSPLITTTRAHAADLAPLWKNSEFFVASTPEELKALLVEFYLQRQDSAWLHLPIGDSLFIQTFPDNKPVWPHRMTIVNSGNLYKTQWRLYQLVMNRADPAWVPLLEDAAGRAMLSGKHKLALFLQDDVVTLTPERAASYSNFALILARAGKLDEARTAVTHALELDSTLTAAQELARQLASGIAAGASPQTVDDSDQ